MSVETLVRNPFMLMLNPEVVIAAMESSELLKQLHRRECRPLDRLPAPSDEDAAAEPTVDGED